MIDDDEELFDAPADMLLALDERGVEGKFLSLLPDVQRRYIEWIESAPDPDTRQWRIDRTVEGIGRVGDVTLRIDE